MTLVANIANKLLFDLTYFRLLAPTKVKVMDFYSVKMMLLYVTLVTCLLLLSLGVSNESKTQLRWGVGCGVWGMESHKGHVPLWSVRAPLWSVCHPLPKKG